MKYVLKKSPSNVILSDKSIDDHLAATIDSAGTGSGISRVMRCPSSSYHFSSSTQLDPRLGSDGSVLSMNGTGYLSTRI